MTLTDLRSVLGPDARLAGAPATGVALRDVTHDSREAAPGVLVACRRGALTDGHAYAPQAVAAGAPALLCERELALDVPQLVVPDVAAVLGPVAAAVHGRPSERLALLGVTGTNGKTTTAFLLEAALAAAGRRTGLIGTIGTLVAGTPVAGVRTTPEATDLQRHLRRMVDAGVTAAAMEVSSHGLALGRVTGTRFTAAGFTNLSQDHLDFHGDLDRYEAAKRSLFAPAYTRCAVVNVDDPAGARIAAAARQAIEVVTVSASGAGPADVSARRIDAGPTGTRFTAVLGEEAVDVALRLRGAFNVENALIALALARTAGVDAEVAADGLARLAGVPGRMEPVALGQPFTVLVDYAHTPESLDRVLRSCRELTDGRVIVVVGCGGGRDAGKRPLMGRAAARLADLAVFTSDNPRDEDPLAILDAMVEGTRELPGVTVVVEADRRAAIGLALAEAADGDVVLLAGKGHETAQEIGGRTVAFDDRVVARECLETMAGVA